MKTFFKKTPFELFKPKEHIDKKEREIRTITVTDVPKNTFWAIGTITFYNSGDQILGIPGDYTVEDKIRDWSKEKGYEQITKEVIMKYADEYGFKVYEFNQVEENKYVLIYRSC